MWYGVERENVVMGMRRFRERSGFMRGGSMSICMGGMRFRYGKVVGMKIGV